VFPYFNAQTPNRVTGYWRFLHEDYLQTLIEWGWLGTALWIFLFGGGMATAFRSAARQRRIRRAAESDVRERVRAREWSPRRRLIVPLATIALAGVALHAIVDFPLQIYSIQLYVASYLGVCWGSAVWK
jgi:O-antigen ligase